MTHILVWQNCKIWHLQCFPCAKPRGEVFEGLLAGRGQGNGERTGFLAPKLDGPAYGDGPGELGGTGGEGDQPGVEGIGEGIVAGGDSAGNGNDEFGDGTGAAGDD